MHWDATEVYTDPFFLRKKQGGNVQDSSSATVTTNDPAPYTLVLNLTPNVKKIITSQINILPFCIWQGYCPLLQSSNNPIKYCQYQVPASS
jgi:hypothetical protein